MNEARAAVLKEVSKGRYFFRAQHANELQWLQHMSYIKGHITTDNRTTYTVTKRGQAII